MELLEGRDDLVIMGDNGRSIRTTNRLIIHLDGRSRREASKPELSPAGLGANGARIAATVFLPRYFGFKRYISCMIKCGRLVVEACGRRRTGLASAASDG